MTNENSFTEVDENDVEFWKNQCEKNDHLSGEKLLSLTNKEIGWQDVYEHFRTSLWSLYYNFLRLFI